jgi:hypothetical protein
MVKKTSPKKEKAKSKTKKKKKTKARIIKQGIGFGS